MGRHSVLAFFYCDGMMHLQSVPTQSEGGMAPRLRGDAKMPPGFPGGVAGRGEHASCRGETHWNSRTSSPGARYKSGTHRAAAPSC